MRRTAFVGAYSGAISGDSLAPRVGRPGREPLAAVAAWWRGERRLARLVAVAVAARGDPGADRPQQDRGDGQDREDDEDRIRHVASTVQATGRDRRRPARVDRSTYHERVRNGEAVISRSFATIWGTLTWGRTQEARHPSSPDFATRKYRTSTSSNASATAPAAATPPPSTAMGTAAPVLASTTARVSTRRSCAVGRCARMTSSCRSSRRWGVDLGSDTGRGSAAPRAHRRHRGATLTCPIRRRSSRS